MDLAFELLDPVNIPHKLMSAERREPEFALRYPTPKIARSSRNLKIPIVDQGVRCRHIDPSMHLVS